MMSKKIVAPVLGASFLMMGLSMPSCPGQQAMQQQVDALKNSETELNNRIGALEGQMKGLKEDLDQTKSLVSQMSAGLTEQAKKMEEMAQSMKAAQAKPAAPAAKGKPKKR